MKKEINNPFSVTKASDFSNEQIEKYWVNFLDEEDVSLNYLLNPNDATMPKYVLGGKGCGKTHLLRYFDYPIQKIRHGNNIRKILSEDKYIGIYFLLGDLNSTRFNRGSISQDRRQNLFEYYMELFLSIQLIGILKEILSEMKVVNIEKNICLDIYKLFISTDKIDKIDNFDELLEYLSSLQKEIDDEIINTDLLLNEKSSDGKVKIRITRGNFILGIPGLFIKHCPTYKDIKFLYILDELEKLTEPQKEYINTLVWEKKIPCSFWIGARTYGFKNTKTYYPDPIRESSEYERVSLDEIFRVQEKKYKLFCERLFKKRLVDVIEANEKEIDSSVYFETFNEEEVLRNIRTKLNNKQSPSAISLNSNLKYLVGKKKEALGVLTQGKIDEILKNLGTTNLLHEKYNHFLLYQDWSKKKNLVEASKAIQLSYIDFIEEKVDSRHYKVEDKFKLDLLAQLLEETKMNNYFSGLNDFIKISWGNPRVFITILKNIYKKAVYNNESPFNGGIISVNSQERGIYESSVWYYNDAELTGQEGLNVYSGISNIAQLLRGVRFSNKPSQTSPSSFSLNGSELSHDAKRIIDLAADHSFIIKVEGGRKDQNSSKINLLYQINRILSPKWNLPIARRGVVPLSGEIVESIFNPSKSSDFRMAYNKFVGKLNAPFSEIKHSKKEENNLFS
jgi:hypothetical protein